VIVHLRVEVETVGHEGYEAVEAACTALRAAGMVVRAAEFHAVPTDWNGDPVYEHEH
jgi:hypothetical protein